jgi:hypothetical protein
MLTSYLTAPVLPRVAIDPVLSNERAATAVVVVPR